MVGEDDVCGNITRTASSYHGAKNVWRSGEIFIMAL